MKESRIVAVDHVCLEALLGLDDELMWFYSELLDLDVVVGNLTGVASGIDDTWLRFRSGRIELRFRIVDDPDIDAVDCCATILVPSLLAVQEVLNERRVRYHRFTGMVYSDRRIGLLDPAGNRVELKQQWPYSPV